MVRPPKKKKRRREPNSGRTKEDSSGEGACQPGGDIYVPLEI